MHKAIHSAFFNEGELINSPGIIDQVYADGRREQLAGMTKLHPVRITSVNFEEHSRELAEIDVVFATWGFPVLTGSQIERLSKLKAIFYAAGSVKGFARPYLERGVAVCSAATANAACVAEFCLGQVLLSCKGYFRNVRDCSTAEGNHHSKSFLGRGTYGEKVAIIGAGKVGRKLIELLKPFHMQVLLVDPYVSEADADELGVQKVSLEEAFQQAYVVSNHLPDLPHLSHVLDRRLFASMRQNSTLINTGRGAQINEPDLISVLRQRPDMTALLDVTDPEPAPEGSPFYELPNVTISSHMSGAHAGEYLRIADEMIEEFRRWQAGQGLRHSVALEKLDLMA